MSLTDSRKSYHHHLDCDTRRNCDVMLSTHSLHLLVTTMSFISRLYEGIKANPQAHVSDYWHHHEHPMQVELPFASTHHLLRVMLAVPNQGFRRQNHIQVKRSQT